MPVVLTPARRQIVAQLRAQLAAGGRPLADASLIAELPSELAAAATASKLTIRPYEDGVIVSIEGVAYAPAGEAEADTMDAQTHHKYLAAKVQVAARPKTNDTFESLYTLVPRPVCWVVAQGDLIEVTFKHLASANIASLMGQLKFGFVPFSELGA